MAARTSLEEYLSSHYEPECELIDGELFPKPPGTLEHMEMGGRLRDLLKHYQQRGLGRVVFELSIRQQSDVRIPDVVFAGPGAHFENGILVDVPMGVPYCWVIDPIKKLAWEYHREAPVQLASVSLGAGEISVTLAELFE